MQNSSSLLIVIGLLGFAISSTLQADDKNKPKYEVKIETIKAQPTMTIRFRARHDELSKKYGEVFGKLFGYVTSKGGEFSGAPFGRYHSMTEEEVEVEAGLPVAKVIEGKGEIKASELPGGKVATTIHLGPYEKLGEAHEAIQAWASKNGHKPSGGVWEYYLTDPGKEPDQSKWQTKLYLPIAEKDASKSKQ